MSRSVFIDTVSELDGRNDQHIRSYYVETHALQRIRCSNVPAIGMVGLKGSGKTTLFRLLAEDWAEEPNVIRIGLAPDRAEFEAYAERINCLRFENSVQQGMLILLPQLIHEQIKTLPNAVQATLAEWIERKDQLFSPGTDAFGVLEKHRGLSILGCGLELGQAATRERALRIRSLPEAESEAILSLLQSFSEFGLKIRIVIDDPDRLFDHGGKPDRELLAGYILGTNSVARRYRYIQFVHILKGNVFRELNEMEEIANLPSDYFDYISWTRPELKRMIEARIQYANVDPNEIFQGPLEANIDLLADRVRNGPRDLLRFLELILKSSEHEKVSFSSIEANSARFKRLARQQVETVYAGVYEGLESFLAAVFENAEHLSYSTFKAKFMALRLAGQPAGVDYRDDWLVSADRAFRALIETGTVDLKTAEGWMKPYEAGYFSFDFAEEAQVRRTAVFT